MEHLSAQERHDALVRDLADEYRRAGHEVHVRPGADVLPAFLARFGLGAVPYRTASGLATPIRTDAGYDWRLWSDDLPRWRAIAPYGDPAPTPTSSVPGAVWTHAPTGTGVASDPVTRAFRSHFRSGPLTPRFLVSPISPCAARAMPAPSCDGPNCFPYGNWPWIVERGFIDVPTGRCAASVVRTFSLQYDGFGALPIEPAFPSAPPFAADDLVWVALAEPVELMRADQTLRFVGVSRDGLRIAQTLHHTAFGYAPRGFQPGCPGGPNCPPLPCDNPNNPNQCFASTSSARSLVASAPPRFVASAARDELFVLGPNVAAIQLDTGVRRNVATADVTVGTILAATYDVVGDRLYVLDEITRPRGRSRAREGRLIAIDPEGGAVVLASWPRVAATARFAMGAGQDGRLYVAASGERGGHVVVALEIEHHEASRRRPAWDEVSARGVGFGLGRLASDVVYASRYEVSFVTEPSGGARVVSYRPDAPHFRLGDCMTDVF